MELLSPSPPRPHREIMRILGGLMLALFSSVLSTMIVTNALPSIVADLGGGPSEYTWVVAASLLTMTVSTPVWGRLSDQFSKKSLVQSALVVFVAGSAGAGLSQSMGMLIAMRAVQGVAMGGLMATSQAVIGSVTSPRERGRYSGYMGAVMAVATLCGPLVGGVIVDTRWLGWRWCFLVVVPFALISLVVLQRRLHLPSIRQAGRVDYTGSMLIAVTAGLPLLWVTFAGTSYRWISWQSAMFLGGALFTGALTVYVERRHPHPIISPTVFRDRTTSLAILGSVAAGVAMFASMLFLSQYFQIARGYSPTEAGLLGMPMMVGTLVGTLGSGHLISRFGRWRRFLVGGSIALTAGLALLSRIGGPAEEWYVLLASAVLGVGIGALLQNYVLAVQNTVDVTRVGGASASIAFFRSLGGAVGVALLGAIVTHRVSGSLAARQLGSPGGGGEPTLDLAALPPAVIELTRDAYAHAIGTVFAVSAGVAVLSLIASLAIRETALRTTIGKAGTD